ncbi:PspC domain-containing protein [Acetobacterium bakii]|uniref:PspC domain-containing protein n=1 Tax=Acetobacterium bakii TaxID=52689 RepID=UPI0009F88FCB|nr:PspC domain-containing protein [Acetobacterium bakii]
MKKRLMRNPGKGIIAGVCAGLGEYFNLSPWIFRALFVVPVLPFVLTFSAGVVSIVLYVVLAIFLPDKKRIEENEVVEVDYEIIEDDEEPDVETKEDEGADDDAEPVEEAKEKEQV